MSEHAQPAEMLNALDSIYANANRLIAQVGADQWSAQTPCTEWKVRDLVNHMAGTSNFLLAASTRSAPSGEPDADHLGDDPIGAFAAIAKTSSEAWRTEGALDGMVSVPAEMPAIAALGVNIIDVGTHCWDLAEAIGADHGLSESIVATIDFWNRQVISDEVRAGGGFGEVLESDEAGDVPNMLAFVGRKA